MIIPTAEPFLFPGGPVGVLLIHGFTGSPKEMKWMGEYLNQKGHTVLGIRLPGHATKPADMLRVVYQDWIDTVEDGYTLLSGCCRDVFAAGLSMGGVLVLHGASRLPLKGVIAISTPYSLPNDWRLPYAEYIHLLMPRIEKGPPDWHNPDAAFDHIDYPYYPTRAIAQLRDLLSEMRNTLPEIHIPVLLVHSRQDQGVTSDNATKIFQRLGSQNKSLLWVENSGHVVTREPDRYIVFQAVATFINDLIDPTQ